MIVLDEQLLGRNIEQEISKWYGGKVLYIVDLRPNTIIKDDAIPGLLCQQNQPTFVTINEKDFWRKVDINERFCVICLVLPDSRVLEISNLLKQFFIYQFSKQKQIEWVKSFGSLMTKSSIILTRIIIFNNLLKSQEGL